MNADLLGLAEPIWAAEHGASVVGIKRKGGYVTRYVGIEGTATEFQRGVPYGYSNGVMLMAEDVSPL